jgi:hypothetical protein
VGDAGVVPAPSVGASFLNALASTMGVSPSFVSSAARMVEHVRALEPSSTKR